MVVNIAPDRKGDWDISGEVALPIRAAGVCSARHCRAHRAAQDLARRGARPLLGAGTSPVRRRRRVPPDSVVASSPPLAAQPHLAVQELRRYVVYTRFRENSRPSGTAKRAVPLLQPEGLSASVTSLRSGAPRERSAPRPSDNATRANRMPRLWRSKWPPRNEPVGRISEALLEFWSSLRLCHHSSAAR